MVGRVVDAGPVGLRSVWLSVVGLSVVGGADGDVVVVAAEVVVGGSAAGVLDASTEVDPAVLGPVVLDAVASDAKYEV